MDLISREEAREKGLKKFYTGSPCKRGHDCERYVTTGTCTKCVIAASGKRYQREKEHILETNRLKRQSSGKPPRIKNPPLSAEDQAIKRRMYNIANQERIQQLWAAYYLKNGDSRRAAAREWYAKNRDRQVIRKREAYEADKEKYREECRKWQKDN